MSTLTSRRVPAVLTALGALLLCTLAGAPRANAGIIFACAKQLGLGPHRHRGHEVQARRSEAEVGRSNRTHRNDRVDGTPSRVRTERTGQRA